MDQDSVGMSHKWEILGCLNHLVLSLIPADEEAFVRRGQPLKWISVNPKGLVSTVACKRYIWFTNIKNLFHDFPNFFGSLANNGLTFIVPKDEIGFMTLMFNLNNNFEPVKLVSGHYYVLHVTFVSNVKQKSVCYWKENKPSNGAFDLLTT
jgi:hypothetical protein